MVGRGEITWGTLLEIVVSGVSVINNFCHVLVVFVGLEKNIFVKEKL